MKIAEIFGNTSKNTTTTVGVVVMGQNGPFISFKNKCLAAFVNKNQDGSVTLPSMTEKGILLLGVKMAEGQPPLQPGIIKIGRGKYTTPNGEEKNLSDVFGYVNVSQNGKVYISCYPSVQIDGNTTGNIFPLEQKGQQGQPAPVQGQPVGYGQQGQAAPTPQPTPVGYGQQGQAPQPTPVGYDQQGQPVPVGYGQQGQSVPVGYGQQGQAAPAGYAQPPVYGQ